ncbi:hypothetical protein M8J77_014454 [Diaphorina citri]|nr:hypothetical protein M8J77_014454 [Diaphorina citri]
MRNTSTPTTSAQPDLNSSSSSSNFEFSSPITKPPPITLNDFITLSQLKGPDIPNQTYSPPPPASTHVAEGHVVRSPSSDLPGFPGTTQPDSASLVKRINELINQRESLIDKISELSSKLSQYEVNVHANLPLSSFRSSKIAIFSDIPQGSLLGNVFFSIMIDGITQVISHSYFLLYADDLKIFKPISNLQDMFLLQQDLYQIQNWLSLNSLSFCPQKCEVHALRDGHAKTQTIEYAPHHISDKIQAKQHFCLKLTWF